MVGFVVDLHLDFLICLYLLLSVPRRLVRRPPSHVTVIVLRAHLTPDCKLIIFLIGMMMGWVSRRSRRDYHHVFKVINLAGTGSIAFEVGGARRHLLL